MARHLWALLLAAVAAAAFLGPALLPGRALVPFPPENIPPLRSEASARGLGTDDLLVGNPTGGDKYNQSLAWDRITRDGLRSGHLPLWTRELGGGAPVVPQMGQIYMPWTWLLRWCDATTVYGPWFFAHQCLLGLLLYHFLRRLGVRHAAALFGMTCAVVGLWTQARVHHNVILSAALPLFGALACVHAVFAGAGWATLGLLACAIGVPWLGGFAPVALQSTYLVLAYALLCAARAPRGARRRPLARIALAFVVGGLLACPQMLPVLDAARDSARAVPSTADLRAHAMSWPHLLTLAWPDLLAWAQPAFYDGLLDNARPPFAALLLLTPLSARSMNWPETAFALGLVGAVLAAAGLGHRARRAEVAFFASAGGLGLLLATGTWPALELSAFVPGARSGDVRRFLFLPAMALSVLAAFGADRWLAGARLHGARTLLLLVALASVALFALHLGDAKSMQRGYAELTVARHDLPGVDAAAFEAAAKPSEAGDNQSHLLATFGRAAIVAALGFVALGRRRTNTTLVLLALLGLGELVHAGRGPVVAVPAARVTTPPRILEPALADSHASNPRPRFQRLDQSVVRTQLAQPNLAAFYGLEDLAIYTSLAPRRREELFTAIEPPVPGVPPVALGGAGVQSFRRATSLTHPLCDVLGLKWVLAADAGLAGGLPVLVDRTPADWPGPERLYERTTCAPRATFLTRVRVVPDRDERLRLLADTTRDAVHEVILEQPVPAGTAGQGNDAARVEIVAWSDEAIALDVDAPSSGVVRVADPFDAGWRARVDGAEVPILIADHFLRAVAMPAGRHRLELTYDAPRVQWPPRLGLVGAGAALLMLVAGAVRRATSTRTRPR
ncbi:MAG: hypothetical protein R3F56_03445 [Planctomycetota bacterium]